MPVSDFVLPLCSPLSDAHQNGGIQGVPLLQTIAEAGAYAAYGARKSHMPAHQIAAC